MDSYVLVENQPASDANDEHQSEEVDLDTNEWFLEQPDDANNRRRYSSRAYTGGRSLVGTMARSIACPIVTL
ncbi:hypothetical protein GCG54_00013974 [Colletotrichum gloeosporioides]|uniref:Uncharacterized protein n=1 Tax=Colletotrichum gloeosporioides TaxID=474922 RepID=A0A8H4CEW4_COLGL|nr:uncharacterized protein GCG54_00013974 [Colletotrichum gloeosporioides]KAF3802740.1 hypothetical protein GCG54_00013974 [Colletotrichum gloeosporioides]